MPSAPGSEEDIELEVLLRLINGLPSEDLPGLINDVVRSVLTNSGLEAFKDDVRLIGVDYHERTTHEALV